VASRSVHEFTITCAHHLQATLGDELAGLGFESLRERRTGVRARGELTAAYRACLWSRTASRVLMTLATGPAADGDQLYATARSIEWTAHLAPDTTFAVEATVSANPAFRQPHFAALRVKDAVADSLRDALGERPGVDARAPDIQLRVLVRREQAVISIDLSGPALHRRGYRLEQGAAPMRETLAAALLMRCRWPRIAAEGGCFVDLMCGAGTLVIEAAMVAADIAPGLARKRWGFSAWHGHDAAAWQALLEEARARQAAGLANMAPVYGFDGARDALRVAQANLARAGLADHVRLAPRDVGEGGYGLAQRTGLVMANPPYGERLGDQQDLSALYAALGYRLREEFVGWRAAVFTGNPPLGRALGMEADRTATYLNGPIDCRLLQFDRVAEAGGNAADAPAGPPSPPVLEDAGARELANRLRKNLRRLARWRRREGVSCYRLYDSDMPEYRVVIDVYDTVDDQVHVHVQEYAAPAKIDAELAARRLHHCLDAVRAVLAIPPQQVHLKRRQRQRGKSQYQRLNRRGQFHEVAEGGARLLVNLDDYLDTGLFLDHRPLRALVRSMAAGKRFLNLFAYTGAVTVAAVLGGACRTTTVDMSRTYLDWARRNLALNVQDLTPHELLRADVMAWLRDARTQVRRYDLIYVDPPSFSTSSRMAATFDVQRDHVALLSDCLHLLAPGGVLLFSNNLRRFKLDRPALAALAAIEDITAATIDEDFARRPHVHQCYRLMVPAGRGAD
jgi:23S rRNA (guanine2445-N2)-methyltransferase / 23S rRNA (guanine2069-N7)-methyltransferase